MAQTRPATPAFGVIALVLLGGAIATVVAAIMMFFRMYQSDLLLEFRHSRVFYLIGCAFVGFFTAIGVTFTRPRGPIAPILAALSAFVALYVGIRIGIIFYDLAFRGVRGDNFFITVWKYRFYLDDLVAPVVAALIAGLRVLMVAKTLAPRGRPPYGRPYPHPGGAHPYQPAAGQPPFPGHQPPVPGQPPFPGQPPAPGQHLPPSPPPPAH